MLANLTAVTKLTPTDMRLAEASWDFILLAKCSHAEGEFMACVNKITFLNDLV